MKNILNSQLVRTLAATAVLAIGAAGLQAQADEVVLNPDHPERYTVVKGDTLWDISGMFLRDPWLWPEIWNVNPQVENPHLIYPGDVLELVWIDGKPQLRRAGDFQSGEGVEKLTPQARSSDLENPIPTIPFDQIAAFLSRAGVMSERDYNKLPHIAAFRDGLVAGAGDEVYVRGLDDPQIGDSYRIIRIGNELRDPDNNRSLGHEIIYVGEGTVQSNGKTANIMLNDTTREASKGDRVVKVDTVPPLNFYPRAPEQDISGQIIAVKDGVALIGQYQMIIINRGLKHGLEQGHVMNIWQRGEKTYDRYANLGNTPRKFDLPDESNGLLMILKPEENTSYALVMDATSEIKVLDRVSTP